MPESTTPNSPEPTTPPVEPTTPTEKMVKESDLLAVKKGLEKQIGDLKTELETKSRLADENYQSLLGERASKEAAEKQLQELQEKAKNLEELEKNLKTSEETREQQSKTMLDQRKQIMTKTYNISLDALEGKSWQELDYMETALKEVGQLRPSGIDGAGGGGGSAAELTAREKMLAGLEERQKSKRR